MSFFDKNGTEITVGSIIRWEYAKDSKESTYYNPHTKTIKFYHHHDPVILEGPIHKITFKVDKSGKPVYRVVAHAYYNYQITYPDYYGNEDFKTRQEKGDTNSSFMSRTGHFPTIEVVGGEPSQTYTITVT